MFANKSLVLLLCLFGAVYGKFIVCESGSEIGEVVDVKVEGCENKKNCPLVRGTNASIEIIFKPKEDSDKLISIVHGHILGADVPFPLPNENGCIDSGLTCPIKKDETYTYRSTLFVKDIYPKITLQVKWQLQNEAAKDFVCVMIYAAIK